ncbi:unnamed protein product [Rotaria sp. Silwood2]|nr:unnamed protein product [Rotaria sp. Silwood2]CAF4451378.1 unnamed protein product [Rotaria sp. Silwood2]
MSTNSYSLKDDHIQRELIQCIEYLPYIFSKLANGDQCSILLLKPAVKFDTELIENFHPPSKSDNEQFLPIIK